MALATYKDLCIDASDPTQTATFWASALGLRGESAPRGCVLHGPTPAHTVWVNHVTESKSVKHRMHLDVVAPSIDPILEACVTLLCSPDDDVTWHVLADPEGNEFCAFDRF